MKCPFCNAELIGDDTPLGESEKYLLCSNDECCTEQVAIQSYVWQALIDGKKAQEALQSIYDHLMLDLAIPKSSMTLAVTRTVARLQKHLNIIQKPQDK